MCTVCCVRMLHTSCVWCVYVYLSLSLSSLALSSDTEFGANPRLVSRKSPTGPLVGTVPMHSTTTHFVDVSEGQ